MPLEVFARVLTWIDFQHIYDDAILKRSNRKWLNLTFKSFPCVELKRNNHLRRRAYVIAIALKFSFVKLQWYKCAKCKIQKLIFLVWCLKSSGMKSNAELNSFVEWLVFDRFPCITRGCHIFLKSGDFALKNSILLNLTVENSFVTSLYFFDHQASHVSFLRFAINVGINVSSRFLWNWKSIFGGAWELVKLWSNFKFSWSANMPTTSLMPFKPLARICLLELSKRSHFKDG